ncbi:MAG TPA: 6-carboxytetrahydropterin synthase [Chitinophagaceae bacterium]|nr:6-carboxytetrahydropterin synthase [Chitinophagaceae bacterium]
MVQITKIFHFEMAHAIHGYEGACQHIHGHSYNLYVTVSSGEQGNDYLAGTGIIIDFKELKEIVNTAVVRNLDHKLVLSRSFLDAKPAFRAAENLFTWEAEPTAENLLVYAQKAIREKLPADLMLTGLKLYETADSFAEWLP